MDPFFLGGLGRNTRLRHLALRTRLKEFAGEKTITDEVAVAFLRSEQTLRQWDHSTMATAAGNLLGAMKAAQKPLGQRFLTALKAIDDLAATAPVRWPEVLTPDELLTAINAATSEQPRVALILSTTTGQRVGDVLKIDPANILDHPLVSDDAMALLLTGGKTSKSRAVPIFAMLRTWADEVRAYIQKRRAMGAETLFDDTPKLRQDILLCIRCGNPKGELRSLRATKILGLGMMGAPMEVIDLVARHASTSMTMHYLRDGLAYGAAMKSMQQSQLPQETLI